MPAAKRFNCIECNKSCSRPNSLCRICYNKLRYRQTRKDRLEYMRIWHQKVKDEVFIAYGGYKCVCCGETEPVFLVIDHINGGGNKERRKSETKGGAGQYSKIKKEGFPRNKYQVLCHNCNFAKSRGGCPHASRE